MNLVSYIAPGAPATRRPAGGDEAYMRPEIGFTPAWYRRHLGIDFGEKFHGDPACRRQAVVKMRSELKRRFAGTAIGGLNGPEAPLDILTGVHGACTLAAIYGLPLVYAENNWPNVAHRYLTDAQVARLDPPDLGRNEFFCGLLEQVDWIKQREGHVEGYINWQGILNNAHRLRGEELFADLATEPERCRHLFGCICETMTAAIRLLHERQGLPAGRRFVTASNCLVNMISPETYADLLFPFDLKLAGIYGCLGIHNCAWNASPYLETYSRLPGLGYIDMGLGSDLAKAKRLFPEARRALMYTPMDLASKSSAALQADFEKIAGDFAPCDVVIADIEAGVPDARILEAVALCRRLSEGR